LLYLAEFHPFSDVFADESLEVTYPYWHEKPFEWADSATYADPEATMVHNRTWS
jgi:hypothetical protein